MGAFYKVNAQDFPATIYYTPFTGTVGTQHFRTCYPSPKVWDLLCSSVTDIDVISVGHKFAGLLALAPSPAVRYTSCASQQVCCGHSVPKSPQTRPSKDGGKRNHPLQVDQTIILVKIILEDVQSIEGDSFQNHRFMDFPSIGISCFVILTKQVFLCSEQLSPPFKGLSTWRIVPPDSKSPIFNFQLSENLRNHSNQSFAPKIQSPDLNGT